MLDMLLASSVNHHLCERMVRGSLRHSGLVLHLMEVCGLLEIGCLLMGRFRDVIAACVAADAAHSVLAEHDLPNE